MLNRVTFDPQRPFQLPLLPPTLDLKNPVFFDLLLKSRTELGELNGYSLSLPNPLLLLSPAILKESVASSEIENIHTTLMEALQTELFPEKEQKEPDKEVLQYREAVLWGFEQLKDLPISTRVIHGIQTNLLPNSGGEYRKQQNQIKNLDTGELVYTPPIASEIPNLLGNWENFVNKDPAEIDPLMKAAIAHYQFEAIHPFGDGNGRTGRILIVLQLIQDQILNFPILYLSGYINKNRGEYYRLLRGVTAEEKWNDFILFMLKGFYTQAKETKDLLFKIRKLFETTREEIKKDSPKIYSGDLIENLFSSPVTTPVRLAGRLGIHYVTASRYLKTLASQGFLRSLKHGKFHFYINERLMKILE